MPLPFSRPLVVGSLRFVVALLCANVAPALAQNCVSLTALDAPVSQNFDAIGITAGNWTDNVTIVGAYASQTGFLVGTGSSTAGGMYSFGAASATDRALGSVASGGAPNIYYALCFVNDTGSALTSVDISYVGEQWRNGGNTTAQKLTAEYQVAATGTITDANVPTTGWVAAAALDFTSPIATATAAALDGNLAANRSAISTSLAVGVPTGQEFWIRWNDINDAGNDHGLAVDDFAVTARGVPPAGLRVSDVSLAEGNSGTTSFDFMVRLDNPAPTGGVAFDIATMDGTATSPSDFTARNLTGITIPAGSQSYTFSVLVNGDTAFESDETFTVRVSNVVGAPVVDDEGLGTILNDDTGALLSVSDVTANEGNSATTPFQFTVTLSQAAPASGVSFDIATSNGTANAPGDYAANSQTGVVIPQGATSASFTVLVNGDTTSEPDETFNVTVSNVSNALIDDGAGVGTIVNDDLAMIHDVQGSGATSPLPTGTVVVVEGVVTASFQTNGLSGFFLQEEDADIDIDPLTSEGIFIFCSACPVTVAEGQRVRVAGAVNEFFGMTQITATTAPAVTITDPGNNLTQITPATIVLPVVGSINDYYEPREGMLVRYTDALSVSEYFELPRYGQIELYQGGRPRQFTEVSPPSTTGYVAHLAGLDARRVILDDENNGQNTLLNLAEGLQYAYYPRQNGGLSLGAQGTDFFRGGDIINSLTGVLHWSFAGLAGTDAWRIRPTLAAPPAFTTVNPRPLTPPAVGGSIRAVGMNLLNYFTTIDSTASSTTGPCGPNMLQDCRGADSNAELARQRDRTATVLCALNPDVAGLMELENTTPSDTINDLLMAVNARCMNGHPYTFANSGSTLGSDAIRVQIVYRSGVVAPFGAPMVDLDPINSRPTMAQVFDVIDNTNGAFGERFTLVANHLKSKGCGGATGGDVDAGDGQGCFSARRTSQANRLLTWLNTVVVPMAGDPDVLLVGDFNSYAQEPPITTITAAGYVDLETSLLGSAAYSYLFDGQLGHLDYALASSSLNSKVSGVASWHINADENPLFDYNDEIRDVGEAAIEEKPDGSLLTPLRNLYAPNLPIRASDHDPVLIGLFDTDTIFRNGFDSTP